jgi:hypothetical protein
MSKSRKLILPMEVGLLDVGEQCRHLAKQALEKHAAEPASGGFASWIQSSHCFRLEEGHGYSETSIRLEYVVVDP